MIRHFYLKILIGEDGVVDIDLITLNEILVD